MSEHSLDSLHPIIDDFFETLLRRTRELPDPWLKWSRHRAFEYLRRRLGYTQSELSRKSGVAQSQISKLEGGGDALLSTWEALFGAMALELRFVPSSPHSADELIGLAKRGRKKRDHRQAPRARPRAGRKPN